MHYIGAVKSREDAVIHGKMLRFVGAWQHFLLAADGTKYAETVKVLAQRLWILSRD